MAELRPYPFGALVRRVFAELASADSIFDLPRRKFFAGGDRDYSVRFHGKRASCALGPAAGPQTQMAQNIVLSWLAGCRIMELKTVQIMDELEIPRPCIDMETVGFNVEWSQELKLEQSLVEYVKGSMLIEILQASGVLDIADGYGDVIFDMSVGYDLAGIKNDRVQTFMDGMLDASAVVEKLRAEIPEELSAYRDLAFRTQLSNTLTLSTFHGCPPDEIERIIEFLLEDKKLHCIIKLNPTLLGAQQCRHLLNDHMGYGELHVPDSAFEQDCTWEQAVGIVDRLGVKADALGLGLGVKFSNTLIVENHRDFFPEQEKQMYLSGQPLHVMAISLVARFRAHFGTRFPISFSAGIDKQNFADAVAIGLVPVTVCSDLLRPGGYGRASTYMTELDKRMDKVGATNISDYIVLAYDRGGAALDKLDNFDASARQRCLDALGSGGDLRAAAGADYERWLAATVLLNTEHYAALATANPRYAKAKNSKAPRKVGSALELFDCVTCDKCVPVCPNHANFAFVVPEVEVPITKLRRDSDGWSAQRHGTVTIGKKKQYGNFVDFCNECGNCDIFCPEDGGPYNVKPRFFGSRADFDEFGRGNGFFFDGAVVHARIDDKTFSLETVDNGERYASDGFEVLLGGDLMPISGSAEGEVDLTYRHIMVWIREAVMSTDDINYINLLT